MTDIEIVRRAFATHSLSRLPSVQIIRSTDGLNRSFQQQPSGASRSDAALVLLGLYAELDRRLHNAPLGPGGLPQLDGITWNPRDSLAGIPEGVHPAFGYRDLWIASVLPHQRGHHLRRPQPHPQPPQTIDMPGENLRPGGQPMVRNSDQFERHIPGVDGGTVHGDIAGWLDAFNSVAGCLAGVLEAFALEAFSNVAGGFISLYGLAATFSDHDRQIYRLWAAYQTCQTLYDMSGPFRDANLFRVPYAQWPTIRPPMDPVLPPGNLPDNQIQRDAVRAGHRDAYQRVLNLERHPTSIVMSRDGRETRESLTGQMYLYVLNVQARRAHRTVLLYLRSTMERRYNLDLSMFRW